MFGMFEEIGPFAVDTSLNVTEKEHSWTDMMNLLFIDQPVGTGFSFSKNKGSPDVNQVTNDLYEFMSQFYKMFPHLMETDLYIAGQSFGGQLTDCLLFTEFVHTKVPFPFSKICTFNGHQN